MVFCVAALIIFSGLGIFSAKYRRLAKEAFECTFRMVTFRPCITKLDEKIKSKLTAKLMKTPRLARFVYKHFKILSWIFTLAFFGSLAYSFYGIYNLLYYGTCTHGSSSTCEISQASQTIHCYEELIVYVIIGVLLIVFSYFGYKYWRSKR